MLERVPMVFSLDLQDKMPALECLVRYSRGRVSKTRGAASANTFPAAFDTTLSFLVRIQWATLLYANIQTLHHSLTTINNGDLLSRKTATERNYALPKK